MNVLTVQPENTGRRHIVGQITDMLRERTRLAIINVSGFSSFSSATRDLLQGQMNMAVIISGDIDLGPKGLYGRAVERIIKINIPVLTLVQQARMPKVGFLRGSKQNEFSRLLSNHITENTIPYLHERAEEMKQFRAFFERI